MNALDDQVRAAGKIPTEKHWLAKSRRPLSSSLIECPGYHGLMTQRQGTVPARKQPRARKRPRAAWPLTPGQRLRQFANLANGTTLLGLAIARAAGTSVSQGPRGLIIAAGYRWRIPFAGAFTLGNVILCRVRAEQLTVNPGLLGHEEKHCSQYAYCLGLPFLPLYFLSAAWSLLRTGDPASANFFERQAGLAAGGYVDSRTPKPAPRGTGGNEV